MQEAGIEREDIAHIELHDCFSIAAILHLEDMGFAEPGAGVHLYDTNDDSLTLNKSGGLKGCGHPVAATGIKQIGDIAKQLEASGSRWGLAQNLGGAGAVCGIHVLEYDAKRTAEPALESMTATVPTST